MERAQSVAVMTYHRHDNYGALLQCYALQQVLKDGGLDPVVIDYMCKADEKPLSLVALRGRGVKACILSCIGSVTRVPRHRRFQQFRRRLALTEYVDEKSICSLGDRYDYYLAGSDNVWNGTITNWDPNYFLKFVKDKNKRKSYAASFGSDAFSPQQEEKCRELLQGISEFLVRERTGADLVKRLTGKEAQVVLDPTMLLSPEQWKKISAPRLIRPKYVLAYQLVPSKDFVRQAQYVAKSLGYPLVFIPFPLGRLASTQWRLTDGPQEWLSCIQHAEYVLTDSFHGTVFSILLHRPFSVMITQLGDRIENLLQFTGLSERIMNGDTVLSQKPIDFSKCDAAICAQRKESLDKLWTVLGRRRTDGK